MGKDKCIFCNIGNERIIYFDSYFFLVKDNYPVSPGHMLIISSRHTEDYFSLTEMEKEALNIAIEKAKDAVEAEYNPDGYNIGMNCGQAAGQTVMHFHCHLIPRYNGDVENPKGGVRHVIHGKGYY